MRYMIYALLLSAGVTILLGPALIPLLKRLKFGQCERELGPKSHLTKQGTPTMGGLMFLFGILAGTLAFSLSATELVLPALLCTVGFALVGFLDDFLKVRCKNTVGLRAYQKIIAQFLIAAIVAAYAYKSPFIGPKIYLAFSGLEWDLGVFYIRWVGRALLRGDVDLFPDHGGDFPVSGYGHEKSRWNGPGPADPICGGAAIHGRICRRGGGRMLGFPPV